MGMNLFQKTIRMENEGRPPVWLMRQAGRYHSHYQELKRRYTFMELCKDTDAAVETTMGPIRDFDFDAAILFSDLLFPLEAMGTGLRYAPGPKLDWHLKSKADLARLKGGAPLASHMAFQGEAMRKIRQVLPESKGLIGFVGGPLTLFYYAAVGSHQGDLSSAYAGLRDGRFEGFADLLEDMLAQNMAIQARGGADTICVMDTCAGDVDPATYGSIVVPRLESLFRKFRTLCPGVPISYYSKGTGPKHWDLLKDLPISCKGVDWNHDIVEVLKRYGGRWAIQGNVDPYWLFLPLPELEMRLTRVFTRVKKEVPLTSRRGWICGLGHGVLPKTPEASVRSFVRLNREIFS